MTRTGELGACVCVAWLAVLGCDDEAPRGAVLATPVYESDPSVLNIPERRAELIRRGPRTVSICTLLDRPARRVVPIDLEFVGLEIPDEFVIGFGLDHEGRYRNLRLVATADPDVLRDDPDAYVEALYGSS